jgi:hypothetical protein
MKSHTLKETKHPDVFRVVDRDGNWENYYVKSKNAYLPGVTTILKRGYAKGAFFEQWLSNHTAEEQKEILDAAAEKGDKVHRTIDTILSGEYPPGAQPFHLEREIGIFNRTTKDYEPLANNEWDALLAFASFWTAHEPVVIASEATLYNIGSQYAGTADAILILTKKCDVKACKCEELVGQIGLYDWKTSSGIRASYSAQVAAYANASNIKEYLPLDYESPDYTAVLRIGTNHKTTGGYEFKSWNTEETDAAFVRFCSARNIQEFEHKPFNPDEDITEIPDTIELAVKKFDFEVAKVEAPKAEIKPTTKHGKHQKSDGKARSRAKAPARHKAA